MKVGNSVRKAIDDWEQGELEAAMLHACNAVDGTAGKVYPKLGNKERFTRVLRENYAILGPMGAPGIDLIKTRFPVSIRNPTASGGKPDIADVLYGIHRCCHAHGDELPQGFELVQDAAHPTRHLQADGLDRRTADQEQCNGGKCCNQDPCRVATATCSVQRLCVCRPRPDLSFRRHGESTTITCEVIACSRSPQQDLIRTPAQAGVLCL